MKLNNINTRSQFSARIADLREKGYQIDTIMHRETVDGMPKVWGQYVLRGIA